MNNDIYRFLTQYEGEPRTYGLVVDRRHETALHATLGLDELGALANDHPGVCAFGKIAVLAAEGIFTFQVNRQGKSSPVFCGNSTAAAIACLSRGSELRTALYGMATAPYDVSSRIVDETIAQTWMLPSLPVVERCWRNRRVLFLKALNEYAIVLGALPDSIHPEAARRELLGVDVGGKLAVISDAEADRSVQFYNSNGLHGAVPQTGIASMALAARSIGWLNDCFPDGQMTYTVEGEPRMARLPLVAEASHGRLELHMPEIEVALSPLLQDLAA